MRGQIKHTPAGLPEKSAFFAGEPRPRWREFRYASAPSHHPMKIRTTLLLPHVALAAAALLSVARGEILYSEAFDDDGAKIKKAVGANTTLDIVNYGNFTVGATSGQAVPEAPHQIAGSAATRGVLMRQKYDGLERTVNFFLSEAADDGVLSFTGNYRVSYDMYLGIDPTATTASAGTTEVAVWALGASEGTLYGRLNRNSLVGTFGWISVDGGFSTEDCAFWSTPLGGTAVSNSFGNIAGSPFATAFPDSTPLPLTPCNRWVKVEITHLDGTVTVKYDGILFHERVSSATEGGVVIGYEDPFTGSTSFSPDRQWMLVDNVVVETATAQLVTVTQAAPFVTATSDTPVTAELLVNNLTPTDFTVTAATLTGAGAPSFAVTTPLPLEVPGNGVAALQITFTPSAPNGIKTAAIELTTTEPSTPSIVFSPLQARRAVAPGSLMAHYKMDELSGTTLVDSSSNGTNGALQVRASQIAYGNPSLIGDEGFAIGFVPANSGTTGSYATSSVLHTPSFSFSAWIKPEDVPALRTIFNRDPDFGGGDKICGFHLTATNDLRVRLRQTTVIETTDAPVTPGTVHHVVVTHRDDDGFATDAATRTRLYLDGALIAEKTDIETLGMPDYPFSAPAPTLHIGSRTAAGAGFPGDMDDIQLYSTELADWQVAAMFASPGKTALEVAPPAFGVTSVVYDREGGKIDVTFGSQPGATYTVEVSTDLVTWEDVTDSLPSSGVSTVFTQTGLAPNDPVRFYRISLNP